MPDISVIMPVYNKEKYFESAIYSVLNQSFTDIEVIVVNDGSSDGSLSLAQQIAEADKRVCLIDVPNGGVSKARNLGLDYARGTWIQFLDADDIMECEYLKKAVQILRSTQVDILFSSFKMIDTQGEFVRDVPVPIKGIKKQSELQKSFIQQQYKTGFFGYISNKIFSRSLLEKSRAKFSESIRLAEDLDFYSKLYPEVESAYFWNGISFYYLQTEENYLNNSKIDYYSQLQVHLDIKNWFTKMGTYSEYHCILDGKITQYVYYILFYDNERGNDLSYAFQFLRARADVMGSINETNISGFPRKIIQCLLRNDLLAAKMLFFCRNRVRTLFRMVKENE